jgi:ClpP class serine protease
VNRIRTIKSGEALAIDPKMIRAGREAHFWIWADPHPENDRVGANKDVAVVHVRGPLEHHKDGNGDSYDSIKERFAAALSGEDCAEEDAQPPKAVILCLDSPGGVVSGLNETVKAIRKMSAEANIPTVAYVDEMAASAAFALACSCDEIYLPASGIAGSIGVISTMVDQTVADKAMGLRFVTLTSGARKSDGHPHVAISSDAITAEQRRVDKLAKQFYRVVQEARGLSPEVIKSYEAGIFLGKEAVKAGLADGVMAWDDVVSALSDAQPQLGTTNTNAPTTKNPLVSQSQVKREGKATMIKLATLIQQTEAALASETDPKKRVALASKLAAFTTTAASLEAKTVHKIDHKETHTSDGDDDSDGGDDDDSDSDEDDEEDEAAEAEGNETDRSDKPENDEESDEEEDEESEESEAMHDEESEEEAAAAKALRSALASVKGKDGAKARGALASVLAKAQKFDKMGARLAQLEKDTKARQKAAMIDEALAKRRITPGEAKQLRTKSMGMVKGFLGMRPKAIVHSTQEDLAVPQSGIGRNGSLSPEALAWVEKAHLASDGKIPVEKFIEDFKAQIKNGAGSTGF